MSRKTLTALLYGNPGAGKTPASLTSPGPVLVLDAEAGSMFAAHGAVDWRPWEHGGALPAEAEGANLVRVFVRDFRAMQDVDLFLRENPGRFTSVVIDSITEVQKRCKDAMGSGAFTGSSTMQDWGQLLSRMELMIRSWRDLVAEGNFDVLVLTAIAAENAGFYGPAVQGALRLSLPGFVDVVGYLGTHRDSKGLKVKGMQISGDDRFIAKDRTSSAPNGGLTAAYGEVVASPINIAQMVERIYT